MPAVSLKNISKRYGNKVILDNISIEFQKNLITVLLGKSGSGKSTILQIINGLVTPDSGTVQINGTAPEFNKNPKLRLKIGYSIQGSGLFPHLSARENIILSSRLNNIENDSRENRLKTLCGLLGISDSLLNSYPHQMSGGEKQRAALARAVFLNPQILLLDEAFSALDEVTRLDMQNVLLEMQKTEPRTIVFVTHSLTEAERIADKTLIIRSGRIINDGNILADKEKVYSYLR